MILCTKFGWHWPSDSGEEVENVKVYDNDNNDKDGQILNRKAHLSLWLVS